MTNKPEPLKNKELELETFRKKDIKSAIEWLNNIYFKLDSHFKPYYTDTKIKELLKEYSEKYCCDFNDITQVDINNFKRWLLKYKAFEDINK